MRPFRLLIVGFALALAGPLQAQPMPDFPFLTVTGEAEMEVAPDTVTVNFQILAFNEISEAAMTTLAERSEQVLTLASEHGLTHEDIESYAIDKRTRRERKNADGQLDILGYEVSQRFTLTIDGLDSYEALMNALLRMDNTTGLNAQFDVADRESLMRELVSKAGKDARTRAEHLAAGLDARIKSVYAINEDGGFERFMAKFGVSQESYGNLAMAADRSNSFSLIAPQTITLSKRVNVIFKIKP